MNNRNILIAGLIIILLAVGGYLFMNRSAGTATDMDTTIEESSASGTSEESMISPTAGDAMMEGDEETTEGEVVEIEVTGQNFSFDPEEITVNAGDTVRITFSSGDNMPHDWVIDEIDGARTQVLQPGDTETIEFVADQAGTYEYYCSVGNHRAMGMVGTLIVE